MDAADQKGSWRKRQQAREWLADRLMGRAVQTLRLQAGEMGLLTDILAMLVTLGIDTEDFLETTRAKLWQQVEAQQLLEAEITIDATDAS